MVRSGCTADCNNPPVIPDWVGQTTLSGSGFRASSATKSVANATCRWGDREPSAWALIHDSSAARRSNRTTPTSVSPT